MLKEIPAPRPVLSPLIRLRLLRIFPSGTLMVLLLARLLEMIQRLSLDPRLSSRIPSVPVLMDFVTFLLCVIATLLLENLSLPTLVL
jgi:hypothetical protein